MDFFAFIFGTGLGFGLALYIAASLLNKNNNLGDSKGQANLYSSGVTFTDKTDRMGVTEKKRQEYVDQHSPKVPAYPTAPRGKQQVEKMRK